MFESNYFIKNLGLTAHPEGGYYRETYRSEKLLSQNCIQNFEGSRNIMTSIYFLIEKNNFSAFHRIKSDELWNFHSGDTLEIIEITTDGELILTSLGKNLLKGDKFQYVVKAGNWFASRVKNGGEFSFVGCVVAPGFDFADFEMADRNELTKLFPEHQKIIAELTRV